MLSALDVVVCKSVLNEYPKGQTDLEEVCWVIWMKCELPFILLPFILNSFLRVSRYCIGWPSFNRYPPRPLALL